MLNFDLPIPAALAVSAFVPLLVGFIWYNPKVFGNAWMTSTGLTMESAKGINMPLVFGLTYIFSFFMGFILMGIVNHHYGFFSMLGGPDMKSNADLHTWFSNTVTQYGGRFRSFRHGALHGTLTGIFFITPIVAINALFERRDWKYILITAGYWTLCLMLMGAIICHFTPLLMM